MSNIEHNNTENEIIETEEAVDEATITESGAEAIENLSKEEIKRKERAVRKAQKDNENEPFNLKKEIFEWVYTIAIALAIVFVIKGFIFDVVKVDGNSMYPTLHHKDHLIVTKLGYKPQQGDIIILDSTYKKRTEYKEEYAQAKGGNLSLIDEISFKLDLPKRLEPKYFVKRIIALPGQTVDIKGGLVYVDGKQLDEPYYDGTTTTLDTDMPVTIDEGYVFVMGDNRNHSTDSRAASLGQVPFDAILGKSQIRIFPFTSMGITE